MEIVIRLNGEDVNQIMTQVADIVKHGNDATLVICLTIMVTIIGTALIWRSAQ